ncbi:hypothetical protein [Pandoraea sputorum]|uniref:hypothetical protein n=1 Tax=Pandoraea sputorum TaxID=93222 RepID=UPI001240E0BA|nr:hypothetical protein [Pandoraea sputorum]VVE80408.1 hypothetical protein PSP31120_02622 [Pandoraea sputorum]
MKRSRSVPLVVIGTMVGLGGCGQDEQVPLRQQAYNSLSECTSDWGDSKYCSQNPMAAVPGSASAPTGSSGSGGSGGSVHTASYYGPRYYWDRDIGKPVVVDNGGQWRSVDNTHITGSSGSSVSRAYGAGSRAARGGFGASAHGFSGGG